MAMAEVFIPDTSLPAIGDDDPYPRAPPPSPEFQPKTFANLFELPTSKFETSGRSVSPLSPAADNSFSFTTPQVNHNGVVVSDTDSPPSPASLDNGLYDHSPEATDVQPSGLLSSEASGFIPIPSHHHFPETSNVCSHSPPSLTNLSIHHLSPQKMAPFTNGYSKSLNHTPVQPLSPNVPSSNSLRSLSRSLELPSLHPHLSQTLDATHLPNHRSAHHQNLELGYEDEDPSHRRRKVSLKRKNEEVGLDPNLEFSFEYSYSSSSGDSTDSWVVIDSSNYPLGKKACCQDLQNNVLSRAWLPPLQKHHPSHPGVGSVSATSGSSLPATTNAVLSTTVSPAPAPTHLQRPASAEFHIGSYPGHTHSAITASHLAGISPHTNISPPHTDVSTSYTNISPPHTDVSTAYTNISPSHTHISSSFTNISPHTISTSYTNISSSDTHVSSSFTNISPHTISTSYANLSLPHTHISTAYTHVHTPVLPAVSDPHYPPVPAHPPMGPTLSVDSVQMMDCGDYRMDSVDSMDCGQSDPVDNFEMESLSNTLSHNYLLQEQALVHTASPHVPLQSPTGMGRSHSSGGHYPSDLQVAARHNFMQQFFSSYHEQQGSFPDSSSSSVARFAKSL